MFLILQLHILIIIKDPDKRDYIVSNEKIENTGWTNIFS